MHVKFPKREKIQLHSVGVSVRELTFSGLITSTNFFKKIHSSSIYLDELDLCGFGALLYYETGGLYSTAVYIYSCSDLYTIRKCICCKKNELFFKVFRIKKSIPDVRITG